MASSQSLEDNYYDKEKKLNFNIFSIMNCYFEALKGLLA